MAMSAPTSMFTHTTQIPRSPLASTLTLVFHICLALAVVLVTAIPSIPREHKSESLTYITVAPPPDLRFDIPAPPPPAPPKLEMPKPEPPKPVEVPFVERPTPPPPPPPPPAPERRAIEPPKEIPISKPAVTVGAFADAPVRPKLERVTEVASVDFNAGPTRQTATHATVADAGFGDVTPGRASARTAPTTANAGFSADMTPKPAATSPRTTSAAGFGNDMTARPAPAAPKPPAQAAGFAAEPPAVPRPAPQAPPPPRADKPVEVIYKPTPNYTEGARAQHIEGEVILEVEFTAAGQVRVLRVVRGLGHGLDEMAQRAAEQIRFKPATSKGTPVDFRANLTILFRLT